MSKLVKFDGADMHPPVVNHPTPDRLVAGNPVFSTWDVDVIDAGRIKTGIWEATPGTTRSIKGDTWEFCTILSGVVELTEDGGEPVTFKRGDTFVMQPGFTGNWKTVETLRKLFVIVS